MSLTCDNLKQIGYICRCILNMEILVTFDFCKPTNEYDPTIYIKEIDQTISIRIVPFFASVCLSDIYAITRQKLVLHNKWQKDILHALSMCTIRLTFPIYCLHYNMLYLSPFYVVTSSYFYLFILQKHSIFCLFATYGRTLCD